MESILIGYQLQPRPQVIKPTFTDTPRKKAEVYADEFLAVAGKLPYFTMLSEVVICLPAKGKLARFALPAGQAPAGKTKPKPLAPQIVAFLMSEYPTEFLRPDHPERPTIFAFNPRGFLKVLGLEANEAAAQSKGELQPCPPYLWWGISAYKDVETLIYPEELDTALRGSTDGFSIALKHMNLGSVPDKPEPKDPLEYWQSYRQVQLPYQHGQNAYLDVLLVLSCMAVTGFLTGKEIDTLLEAAASE